MRAALQHSQAGETPAIVMEGVTKSFGGRTVLNGLSLEIQPGCGFCLLGRSGTGKSVTLKHIIALMRPDSGRILVRGCDITALAGRELSSVRRTIGFLFQNSALLDSISLCENVAFPLRRHTDWPEDQIRDTARARLRDVGLENDYDTMPADLSGGMRKRAGLARAMALEPDILLVDEPTAGLDPITGGEIDELLVRLRMSGTTLVVVTHDIPSARHLGDALGVLHQGRIIARGTPEELDRSDDTLVQSFMHAQGGG